MEAELTRLGDQYVVTWPETQVAMEFTRLTDRHYGTTAELVVQRLAGEHSTHLWGVVQVCLTNSRAIAETAQQLDRRIGGVDWDTMLMVACTQVLYEHRKPEPPVALDMVEAPARMDFISRFMPENELTIIAADGGSGKSLLALGLATCVMTDTPLTSRLIPARATNALYLDYETTWETHERRLSAICRGLEVPKPHIIYQRMSRPLTEDVPNIRRMVDAYDIGLLIVDSIMPATGAGTNDVDGVVKVTNALRQIGSVTTLGLTHVAKAQTDQRDGKFSPMGSVQWKNQARQVWTVRRGSEPGEDSMVMGFTHLKTNDGRLEEPFALQVDFTGETVTFSQTSVVQHAEIEQIASLADRIANVLRAGAKPVREIAEELELTPESVRAYLTNRQGKSRFRRIDMGGNGVAGTWGLNYED